jgi:hypothetical protein
MSEVFGGQMVFPIHNTGHGEPFDEGMSLRDYCAIQAMRALLSRNKNLDLTQSEINLVVKNSYEITNAMMEAR